ncbi:MAG: hypothetical protein RLZZ623_3072, partial [Actinomycetota bacterium]
MTKVIGACALLAGTALPWNTDVTAATPGRFVTGWIPNWSTSVVSDGTRALDAGQGYDSIFVEASPFAFTATAAGTIALSGTEANLA